jgi:hypothetical protein
MLKNKIKYMRSRAIFVPVNSPLPTFERLNQSLCRLWHLNPSQRRTSQIPPITLFLYMYPPTVAGQRLSRIFPR